ncbi:MAG: hypothetical protein IMF06_05415 [Proteobacteria bacterium]|nr:hypothetical protein [Pseudomonadota bacterium]
MDAVYFLLAGIGACLVFVVGLLVGLGSRGRRTLIVPTIPAYREVWSNAERLAYLARQERMEQAGKQVPTLKPAARMT